MGVYYSHFLIPRDNTVRPAPDKIIALAEAWKSAGYILSKNVDEESEGTGATIVLDDWRREQRQRGKETDQSRSCSWMPKVFARKQSVHRLEIRKPFLVRSAGGNLEWLSSTGVLIEWAENDRANAGTTYPMSTHPDHDNHAGILPGYAIQIHLSDDFINVDTDLYGGDLAYLSALCKCGYDLVYADTGIGFEEYRIRKLCPSCGQMFRPQDQLVGMRDGVTGRVFTEPGGLCYRFAIVLSFGKNIPGEHVDLVEGVEVRRDPKAARSFIDTCEAALELKLHEVSHYS